MVSQQSGKLTSLFELQGRSDETMYNICRSLIAGFIWVLSSIQAQAHDFWIEPDSFTPREGQDVAVFLRFGVGFKSQTLPYITPCSRIRMSDEDGRADVLSRLGNDPLQP